MPGAGARGSKKGGSNVTQASMTRRTFCAVVTGAAIGGALVMSGAQPARADEISDIKQRGTLRVGVKADYPPFGFRAPSGQIEGIEPSLAVDVAKRLGVKLELVPVVASNRMQFLEQGKIDLLIATMSDTPERRRVVDIVQPDYYASGYNLMVPKSANITSWDQIKGKPVCGIQGSYYNKQVGEKYGGQVTAFTGTAEALTALKQGRCIGFLYDDTAIQGDLMDPAWSGYDMPLDSQDAIPWGIAVRKGEPDWSKYISDVIKDWAKNGTIIKLAAQYNIKPAKYAVEMHQKYSS